MRLVPQLACALGLLPLLASVLHGWVVRLQAERRHFGGADSAGGSPAAQLERAKAHAPSLQQEEGQQQQQQQGHGQTGADEPASNDASGAALKAVDAAAATELEQDAEAGGAVAAEISEPAAVETLALLEAIAADVAGEAALNESGGGRMPGPALNAHGPACWQPCCLPACLPVWVRIALFHEVVGWKQARWRQAG